MTRVRRMKLTDLLLGGFVVLLGVAVLVNGFTTVHDTKRARLDKKLAAKWFKQHPRLGRFGPPRVKIGKNKDLACAARQERSGGDNPIDGYCILIQDSSTTSTRVLASYRCYYPRAAHFRLPTHPRCIARHT